MFSSQAAPSAGKIYESVSAMKLCECPVPHERLKSIGRDVLQETDKTSPFTTLRIEWTAP